MPIKQITRLISKAFDKKQDQVVWEAWISLYPWMEAGHLPYQSFEEFKNVKLNKQSKYTQISLEEVDEEIMKVVAAYEKRQVINDGNI